MSASAIVIYPILLIMSRGDYLKKNKRRGLRFILTFTIISSILYLLFIKVPYFKDKINRQYQEAVFDENNSFNNRIGSIFYLSEIIAETPYLGLGVATDQSEWSIIAYSYGIFTTGGNGMFLFISRSGIPFFILVLFLMFFSFKRVVSIKSSLMYIFLIILLLQGEAWLSYPLIYTFFFIDKFIRKKWTPKTGQLLSVNSA